MSCLTIFSCQNPLKQLICELLTFFETFHSFPHQWANNNPKHSKIYYTLTKTNETLNLNTNEPQEVFLSAEENFAFHPPQTKSKNHSRRWKYTLPDLTKICFICDSQIKVKYNLPRHQYSKKNLWGYWTEKPTDQHKYICNSCLKKNLIGRFEDWGVSGNKSRIFHIYLDRNRF